MALTYGFFNSREGDRRYSAKQFGSIFDGVIEDGVFMKIGGKMMVKASGDGFQINVESGRAWFNHTWTLNDTIYALLLPQPEVLLDKYVAVCLEIDERNEARRNSLVLVSGTPATEPTYPPLIDTELIHQHPLAYCRVRAGATYITQADIINTVGTSACPFVTGAVQNMDIDDLVARWETQYTQWFNRNNTEFTTFMSNSHATFNNFMSTSEETFNDWWTAFTDNASEELIQFENGYNDFMYMSNQAFNAFMTRIDSSFEDFTDSSEARITNMLDNLENEFDTFWNDFKSRMENYLSTAQADITAWYNHIRGQLDQDAATNLQNQIDAIKYIYVNQNRVIIPNTAGSVSGSRLILSTP